MNEYVGPHGNYDCSACITSQAHERPQRYPSDLHAKLRPHQGDGNDPIIVAYWVECPRCRQKGPERTDMMSNARGKAVYAWNEIQLRLFEDWQWQRLRLS